MAMASGLDVENRARAIREQVEHYFSDANLTTDKFFRRLVMDTPEGWVDTGSFLTSCRRLQRLKVSGAELEVALADSHELEVAPIAPDRCLIRRVRPFRALVRKGGGGKREGTCVSRSHAQYDPHAPCGYHVAGYCHFQDRCDLRHSIPLAMAYRRQWLHPTSDSARSELLHWAQTDGGSGAVELFPGVFSKHLSCAVARDSLGRDQSHPDPEVEDGFEWDYSDADRPPGTLMATPRHFLVFDLEGKDEIIEFPVIAIDAGAQCEVGRFQRFVQPVRLFEGHPLTPDSPAVPFTETLSDFDTWLHETLGISLSDVGSDVVFLTCGDWDCRQVHTQCRISGTPTPPAFRQWVNIKRTFSETYGGEFRGMRSLLARARLLGKDGSPEHGFHHLGMHDVENICRCLLHLLKQDVDVTLNGFV